MTRQLETQFEHNLKIHLKQHTPEGLLRDVYEYVLLPAGKLFRPYLAASAFQQVHGLPSVQRELKNPHSSLSLFCSLVEIHHAYTLVHDDLPAMDDDDERRGRPSAHIQFPEWKALLAGDGLHALSYRLLSLIQHPQLPTLMRLMSGLLGPKGLIHGQALDLSETMNESFSFLKQTHQLKTARLIQFSLLGGHLIAERANYRSALEIAKLGETLGLLFQFVDDLSELAEDLSPHELQVNPWLHQFEQSYATTTQLLKLGKQRLDQAPVIHQAFSLYSHKMLSALENESLAQKWRGKDQQLVELIALFKLLSLS